MKKLKSKKWEKFINEKNQKSKKWEKQKSKK